MRPRRSSYVNLKYLAEFNKYMMALGAAAFAYFDKFELHYEILRTVGAIFSAVTVTVGIIIMSTIGRIQGDCIDYKHEKDQNKRFLFLIVSRALYFQLSILVIAISAAGWLSLAKIWKW